MKDRGDHGGEGSDSVGTVDPPDLGRHTRQVPYAKSHPEPPTPKKEDDIKKKGGVEKKNRRNSSIYICQRIVPKNNSQHQSSERTCESAQSE